MQKKLLTLYVLLISLVFTGSSWGGEIADVDKAIERGEYDRASNLSIESEHYLKRLVLSAREKNLSSSPLWQVLIHYKPTLFFGMESQVDSPSFFLSEAGKRDPDAELMATLASFFSKKPVGTTEYEPQCRFPARYSWLKEMLAFDPAYLPEAKCDKLEEFAKAIAAQSLTVIFPSTHPNSPSSMFGHTLLRVDKEGQTDETRMLAFSVNYAAMIPQDQDMLSYTVMGLSGGFYGRFMVLPYYLKLREYGQIENRDLWEYTLNVPPEKIDFVLKHAFELAYSHFDYYFFTENCSYHLLSLLDVLYAEETLTSEFDFGWTVPVDTLKALERRGLIKDVRFYPSQARLITGQRDVMDEGEQRLALQALDSGIESTIDEIRSRDSDSQVRVLDLLTEYQRYTKVETSEETVSSKLNSEERKTLRYRSKLLIKSPKLDIQPPGPRPDYGHGSSRIGVGTGEANGVKYTDFLWRAAYHDLLDPSQGFVSNSSLSFLDVTLRKTEEQDKVELQKITIIDVQSLEPRDSFFRNTSWHSSVQLYRSDLVTDPADNWFFVAEGGSGYTYHLFEDKDDAWYGFVDAGVKHDHSRNAQRYSLFTGVSSGLILEPVNGWRVNLNGEYKVDIAGYELDQREVSLLQSVAINRNASLRFQLSKVYEDGLRADKASVSLFIYY
ncbi:MAG: DUF4105 domain-containing protein [Thiotrichaceae bacterium]|nr:DUF4105 domain-containing protein [Thiotrichaceae bacterium]PCI10343.1 MAG: hypothetical protein COB71_12960 [Thiotrichales bacterium]